MRYNFLSYFVKVASITSLTGLTGFASCSMSGKSSNFEGRLTLYYHHHSYYARKVWLALEEKKIPFHKHLVNIVSGENYEPWFMAINAKGEIPVMKDGDKVIIDSKTIIDYLEDNFSQDEEHRLVPQLLGSDVPQKVQDLRKQVDSIEGNLIQFGLLFHREYIQESDEHYPYSFPFIKSALKKSVVNMAESLREKVEKYPEAKDLLLQKAERAERTSFIAQNKDEFDKELDALRTVLAAMEQQLATLPKEGEWWLVCERFTLADVSLTILMDRLWLLGGAEHFWGHLPHLKSYFKRVQERPAYKELSTSLLNDTPILYALIGGVAGILGLAGAAIGIPLCLKR